MNFTTSHASPTSITSETFHKAAGAKGFKAVVEAAGGAYFGVNASGERIFRGDDLVAKAVAGYGFNVHVHEGTPEGLADSYHRRTGGVVAWAAVRPVGLPVAS